MSKVFPGIADVIASLLWRVSIFMRLDLPTLERPIKAYSGRPSVGHFFTSLLLITKRADFITGLFFIVKKFYIGEDKQKTATREKSKL
jgi:hypothetical protein